MRARFHICTCLLIFILPLLLLAMDNGDVNKGKEIYSRCAVCHGASGEGNEAIAKVLEVTMPPLGSKEIQSLDNATLRKVILEGKGKMKPVKLSDQQVKDVIVFLRSLKK